MSMMLFIFLCFAGLSVMFFYILRSQEKFQESMREEHAQMRALLRIMESRLLALGGEIPETQSLSRPLPGSMLGHDPLDSLSMGEPPSRNEHTGNELELHFDPQENLRR